MHYHRAVENPVQLNMDLDLREAHDQHTLNWKWAIIGPFTCVYKELQEICLDKIYREQEEVEGKSFLIRSSKIVVGVGGSLYKSTTFPLITL